MINHLLYYALIPQFITGNASSLHYSQLFVRRGTQQLNGLLLIYIRLAQNCCGCNSKVHTYQPCDVNKCMYHVNKTVHHNNEYLPTYMESEPPLLWSVGGVAGGGNDISISLQFTLRIHFHFISTIDDPMHRHKRP